MPILLDHPENFKTGLRVLFLRSRNKDGLTNSKSMTLISRNPDEFDSQLMLLAREAKEGQRIYASAGDRSIRVAAKNLKLAMLENDYHPDSDNFYEHLYTRWVSALMQVNAQLNKIWLFDCDNEKQSSITNANLMNINVEFYAYPSKNGYHFLTKPFDMRMLVPEVAELKHTNPLMLWGY